MIESILNGRREEGKPEKWEEAAGIEERNQGSTVVQSQRNRVSRKNLKSSAFARSS